MLMALLAISSNPAKSLFAQPRNKKNRYSVELNPPEFFSIPVCDYESDTAHVVSRCKGGTTTLGLSEILSRRDKGSCSVTSPALVSRNNAACDV